MKELKCKNCGAPLERNGKCSYCGSVFEVSYFENEIKFVEVGAPKVETLQAVMEVPFEARHYMKDEDISAYSLRELSRQLAEGLAGYMRLDVMEDPCRMATIVRGRVRVLPPNSRF